MQGRDPSDVMEASRAQPGLLLGRSQPHAWHPDLPSWSTVAALPAPNILKA